MANTPRGNGRSRNRHDQSWYDRSLADKVRARQPYVAMDIPRDKVGLIIGKKGSRLQEIKELSGAHVVVKHDKVHLTGTPEQCEKAKKIIEKILNPVSIGGRGLYSEKWGIPCPKFFFWPFGPDKGRKRREGHIGQRRVLSPLHQPGYYPLGARVMSSWFRWYLPL